MFPADVKYYNEASSARTQNNFKIDINYLAVCSNNSFNEILEHMNLFACTYLLI